MNYLELVKRAVQESRVQIPAVSTVAGLTGLAGDIARWVAQAAADIDNENPRGWRWLRVRDFTATLTVADMDYSVTGSPAPALGLATFAEFDHRALYTQKADGTQKAALTLIDYDKWVEKYRLATFTDGQPTLATMADADTLLVNALPDVAYQLKGDYWKTPSSLIVDASTPHLPVRWHMLIVWEAVKTLAQDRENATLFATATGKANDIRMQMAPQELEIPAAYSCVPLVR